MQQFSFPSPLPLASFDVIYTIALVVPLLSLPPFTRAAAINAHQDDCTFICPHIDLNKETYKLAENCFLVAKNENKTYTGGFDSAKVLIGEDWSLGFGAEGLTL